MGWSVSSFGQIKDEQIQLENRFNTEAQQDKPYLILISVDGFRYDYFDKFKPSFLNNMRNKGVSAEAMIPSYPSVTFPNHYTLVTGLLPPHHGLVGNRMYDPDTAKYYSLSNPAAVKNPDWYGGVPIWSLAEDQHLLSACFYWPGSEAKIAGYYPSYYYPYSETKGIAERVKRVTDWLELPAAKRPHLITFYFPEVDQAGHKVSPEGLETKMAVKYVDAAIKKLVQAVHKTERPVNYVFVSDHGMTAIDTDHPIKLPKTKRDSVVVVNNGTYTSVFVKNKAKIKSVYKRYKKKSTEQYNVYLKTEVPSKYKFSEQYDRHHRIGDIVLIAEAPYYFQAGNRSVPKGGMVISLKIRLI